MSETKTIVLKLGGSVLRSPDDTTRAVLEVERSRREGYVVVVVCSAFHGRTDELELLAAAPRLEGRAFEAAEILARGEFDAAQRLIWALRTSGLDPVFLTPAACGLRAEGDPLEATEAQVDAAVLRRAVTGQNVVVVPGFSGVDARGRTVLLGRGGSDWSALLLADGLRSLGHEVRCRLVKDVDALYDRDPHASFGQHAPLRRFSSVCFEDLPPAPARAQDAIVQPRAVRFAADRGLPFEIAGWNGATQTLVGAESTRSEPVEPGPKPLRNLRVALLGAGNVGGGVARALASIPHVELVSVLVRDAKKARPGIDPALLTHDVERVFTAEPDLVIELLGGLEPASAIARRSLERGLSFVSANKSMLDAHGEQLAELAATHGGRLAFGAAIGGGVPMLETVQRLAKHRIVGLRGVLNGTTNFVLDQVRGGATFDEALEAARAEGLCESDPSSDLEGRDAAHKLRLLLRAAGLHDHARDDLPTEALTEARLVSATPTQIASFDVNGARVTLEELTPGDALARLAGASNRLELELADGRRVAVQGPGAGRGPTSRSVLGDVLQILRDLDLAAELETSR